ncbi:MAG: ferritin-like domain-containing protein [Xanthomonadales bacterium]|nr:ferritin-like domain-containing protein [Xanthomonadales bacterium]
METLAAAALRCLLCTEPSVKLALSADVCAAWQAGDLALRDAGERLPATHTGGRPQRPRLVAPRQLPKRGLGQVAGRVALLHAVAHIEFNAVNLAWDAVYRFADMPRAYYDDWVQVAADEARHFGLLNARLAELGHAYGDFDAHNGLWEMAIKTADSALARMALVPRVLEARGLDVTPGMITRLQQVEDHASVAVLETILREEVAHVAAGSRWFAYCCEQQGLDPQPTFAGLLQRYMSTPPRPPFNRPARLAAGFSDAELDQLECTAL